jgi:hypothetical protein
MSQGLGTLLKISNEQHNHWVLTFTGYMRQSKSVGALDAAENLMKRKCHLKHIPLHG